MSDEARGDQWGVDSIDKVLLHAVLVSHCVNRCDF